MLGYFIVGTFTTHWTPCCFPQEKQTNGLGEGGDGSFLNENIIPELVDYDHTSYV